MANQRKPAKPELRLEHGQGGPPAGLGELLVAHRMISQPQLRKALDAQAQTGAPLPQILLDKGFISEEGLLRTIASHRGLRPWHLDKAPPAQEAIDKVPAKICRAHCVLPVKMREGVLVLAMREPDDQEAIAAVSEATGLLIEPVLASVDRLAKAIETAHGCIYRTDGQLPQVSEEPIAAIVPKHRAPLSEAEMRQVLHLVRETVTDAMELGVTDIHIEFADEKVHVRYGLEGPRSTHRHVSMDLHGSGSAA